MDCYKILDVKKTGDKEKIKKAYRKKSLKAHPDQGGNSQEFDTINRAYRILVNDENRARYDNGEDVDAILRSKVDRDSEIKKLLAEMFIQLVQSRDVDYADLFELMKDELKHAIRGIEKLSKEENKKILKFNRALNRVNSKKKNDFFKNIIEGSIRQIESSTALMDKKKKDFQDALEFMEDFSYSADVRESSSTSTVFYTSATTSSSWF